jgi:hypothetical protein
MKRNYGGNMQLRIRSIKPEYFKHETIFDLEKNSGLPFRIAFAGLWCASDREGRFEWRPRILKAEILPYDDGVDFSLILDELARAAIICKYEVAGKTYGYIPTFLTHQRPNNKEALSKIPEPPAPNTPLNLDKASLDLDRVEGEGEREEEPGRKEYSHKDESSNTRVASSVPDAPPKDPPTQPEAPPVEDSPPPTAAEAPSHFPPPIEGQSVDFGKGPFDVAAEIQGEPAIRFVASQVPPIRQREWLGRHGPKVFNESLAKAVVKKLGQLKTEDPRNHQDWLGYLENWFKKETRVKFAPSPPKAEKPKQPSSPWPAGAKDRVLGGQSVMEAFRAAGGR